MLGVKRIAVFADRTGISARLNHGIDGIVARSAERADRPEDEGIVITAMRREMIGHGRRRDLAFRLAEAA